MSDELFEVAFSGQVIAGADLNEVKVRVAKMFNADDAMLAQLFSGKRIVIKKNIDQQTAVKYQTALDRVGAECEVKSLSGGAASEPAQNLVPPEPASPAPSIPSAAPAVPKVPVDYGDVLPPPQTDPLGITGDQIEDLAVSMAPVGSELQTEYKEVSAPEIDVSDLNMAPVGSDIGSSKKEPEPPPPDTSGISMAD
jgi:hypothetical protein